MTSNPFIILLSIMYVAQYLSGYISLPMSFDWRNIYSKNFASPLRNQYQNVENISQYDISWVMAATSTIADRMNIYMGHSNLKNDLSVQSILNVIPQSDKYDKDIYKYVMEYGVSHETYHNSGEYCQQCERLYIEGYGKLINASVYDIKREIYKNGPITCVLKATKGLEDYTSGIYKEYSSTINPHPNHVVSIVGWGYENGTDYYIVRNSWGYSYGEGGFFRIVTGNYKNGTGKYWNLGIEQECSYPWMGEWRLS